MQNIRACPLESYVSNHRQAHDELLECFSQIECAVPGPDQKVERVVYSVKCTDRTLQEATCLIRANTNNMR